MNKTTAFLLIVITALSFILGATVQSKAQNKNYSGIVPFATGERIGFFDQSNGRVYIYDNKIINCLFVGQMQGLGQPISIIPASKS
jgi:hypothetical protein